jgi:ABC-type antimicrobial peptide transport system permease subunit
VTSNRRLAPCHCLHFGDRNACVGARVEPLERTLAQPRFLVALLGALASVVGVFGVVNHQGLQRTREIGIRIALGAEARSIGRLVLWRALLPTALGITLGVWVLLLLGTPTLQS